MPALCSVLPPGGAPGAASGVGRMGVFSPLRRRLSGLTRWKKPRRAIVGPAALDGTDEVVTRGSAAEARFAVGAVETSCARFRTGSAGNLTTSAFAGGTV